MKLSLAFALLAPLLAACGSDAVQNAGTGAPADPSTFTHPDGGADGAADAASAPDAAEPPPPPPGVFDWRDAIVYFVFVDRFVDAAGGNCSVTGTDAAGNYMGGDWAGVTQKIDAGYFNDLGVNTLWVTEPFKNADAVAGHGQGTDTHMYSAYHGYWPLDPQQLESCFGSQADLTALVTAAHQKKLKVLFDYAMVHVHKDSQVFQQHNDWFWPLAFNNGQCICDDKGVCPWATEYQRCWFTDYLPHWNYTNPAARDYSVGAAMQLVKDTGADGMRLDAIKHVDDTWLTQLRQETSQYVAQQTPPQRFYMVGETYDFQNRSFIRGFVDPQKRLDGQFDFPLRQLLVEAVLMRSTGNLLTVDDLSYSRNARAGLAGLSDFMDANDGYYGQDAIMSTFVGNHDLPRSVHLAEDQPMWGDSMTDGKDRAWSNAPQSPGNRAPYERLALAFSVLLTSRGAPLIYYGDEIGLPGAGDPDNRRPMQWTGLSADQQYLYATIKALTGARAAHPALRRGLRQTINVTADTWLFKMSTTSTTPEDVVYVALNRGDNAANLSGLPNGAFSELVTGTTVNGPSLSVPPRQARILVAK